MPHAPSAPAQPPEGVVDAGQAEGTAPLRGGLGRTLALLAFVLLAPVALFVAVVLLDHALGAPGFTRDDAARVALPPREEELGLPAIEGPLDATRPLVVIDAGHGGHDPGAQSGNRREKDLTLTLANALRGALLKGGGIRVAMTRSDDRYLLLEERSGIARRLRADLFISIHTDSADAEGASGATVYTLSTKGSSEEAEKLAAAENRADTVNGIALAQTSSAVSAILVDLSQRHTAEISDEFARLVLREGEGRITFRDRPLQSAAFVVLKSPDVPSVLLEAGYITNPEDAARLASAQGRGMLASATAQAIRVLFARRSGAAAPVQPLGGVAPSAAP